MNTYDKGLMWFRRDLRWEDNTALHHALKACRQVWCVFVLDRDILDALPRQAVGQASLHPSVGPTGAEFCWGVGRMAELAQARADGTLIADGQTGATHRELSPALYPQMQATLPQNRDAQNAQSRQAPGAM